MSGRLRDLLAIALRAPRRRLGAAALAEERARPSSAPWAVAVAAHLLLLALVAAAATAVNGKRSDPVFAVILRAPEPVPLARTGPEEFPRPDELPTPESTRAVQVGAVGAFSLDDVLSGRGGIAELPSGEETEPAAGFLHLAPRTGMEEFEVRRQCGAIHEGETALAQALNWLHRHQRKDGAWGGPDPQGRCHTCLEGTGPSVGLTALSVLAFSGADWSRREWDYRHALACAVDFLLDRQGPDGCFAPRIGGYLYDHGFATWAFLEAAQRIEVADWRIAAQRAVWFIENSQQESGGFDYTERPSGRSDVCVTAVMIAALRAAADAGLRVRCRTLRAAHDFLEQVSRPDGSAHYAHGGPGVGTSTRGSTASVYLARLYLGDSLDDPWLVRARERLVAWRSRWEDLKRGEDPSDTLYFWFLASQGLIRSGPDVWRRWNLHLQLELAAAQEKGPGCASGSWTPPDAWISAREGPVLSTALGALVLETYTRQEVCALFPEPLRPARERVTEVWDSRTVIDLIHRAVEEGDRSMVSLEPPGGTPPMVILEFVAAARELDRRDQVGPLLRGPRVVTAWRACIADPGSSVRRRAAELARDLAPFTFYDELAQAARTESDVPTRLALLAALEKAPERKLVEPAMEALADSDPRVVCAALRVARACRVCSRLDECLALARTTDSDVAREAATTVLAISPPDHEEVGKRARGWLTHPDPSVRSAAEAWCRRRDLARAGANVVKPK